MTSPLALHLQPSSFQCFKQHLPTVLVAQRLSHCHVIALCRIYHCSILGIALGKIQSWWTTNHFLHRTSHTCQCPFWAALSLTLHTHGMLVPSTTLAACLLVGVLLSSYLLVAEIPMFALKFKSYGWKGNELRFSFIIISALLLVILKWGGFSLIIVLYILTSILNNMFGTKVAHNK